MELLLGTKGEYIIFDTFNDRISICKKKRNWFEGSKEESIVSFPLSAVEEIDYDRPRDIFDLGTFIVVFDSDDNVHRQFAIRIPLWRHEKALKTYYILRDYKTLLR